MIQCYDDKDYDYLFFLKPALKKATAAFQLKTLKNLDLCRCAMHFGKCSLFCNVLPEGKNLCFNFTTT